MVYSANELNANEDMVVDIRPHWWFFSREFILLVGSLVLAVLVALVWNPDNVYISIVAIAPFIAAVALFIWKYLNWMTTRFVVTTDRLIVRSGVLTRNGIEIPLERVNTVFFSQTLFVRIIGSGDLVIESAGEQGQQHFANIRKPLDIQNTINHQMEASDRQRFGNRESGTDIASQIEKLDALRSRGAITSEEFERTKRQLLDRI